MSINCGEVSYSFLIQCLYFFDKMGCVAPQQTLPPRHGYIQNQYHNANFRNNGNNYASWQPSNTANRPIQNNQQPQKNTKQIPSKQVKTLQQANFNEMQLFRRYGYSFARNYQLPMQVKVPQNQQKIKFTYIKQPLLVLPKQIGNVPFNVIKTSCFQEKMTWLRMKVQGIRVSWHNGAEKLLVDRQNVLMSGIGQLTHLNLRKQLKITFDGEEAQDAGGVLRQWMHLSIKEIFNFEIGGLFKLCKTDETAYRFIVDPLQNEDQKEYRTSVAQVLGIIIGKSIFERIPLDCFLTRSIWRQICSQTVEFCDFYSYDEEIYKNYKQILKMKNSQDLECDFTYLVNISNDKDKLVLLKEKGDQIKVNDSNKQEYVNLMVEYLTAKSCKQYIDAIKKSINNIMPLELISIFEPHQIEMLINGPPYINVKQWKASTKYNGYNIRDPMILWFWEYVERLDQKRLGNLLHFVTGSRRVPILGFFYLQSNRNQICRFIIQKVPYIKSTPYPKSHTCFNRLDLPVFPSKVEFEQKMDELLTNEINSFGMS